MIIQGITLQNIGFLVDKIYAAVFAATDAFFNLTSLLIHADGTNGAANATFLDSSTNAFTVTTSGPVGQGTFSPFSQTGWSNYFNGSTDYLQTTVTAPGTNFTVEGWVNLPVVSAAGPAPTFIAINNGSSSTGFELYVTTSGWGVRNNTQNILGTGGGAGVGTAPTAGTWHHVAFVRNSGTVTLYVDGTSVGSNSTSFTFSDTAFTIGNGLSGTAYYTGYVSNVRYVSDTALYTSNFTPSTTPLAISGVGTTQILTSQSNRFVDNSTTPKTFTINGTPKVQPFSPFPPGVAYSTSTVGGSGYFNGTSTYLTVPYNSAFDFAVGQVVSFETWVYPTSYTDQFVIAGRNWSFGGGGPTWGFTVPNATNIQWAIAGTGSATYILLNNASLVAPYTIPLNAWTHVAFTRDASGNNKIFVNGYLVAARTDTQALSNASGSVYIGVATNLAAGSYAQGYMSGLKLEKGSIPTLYQTSSTTVGALIFTPPTSPVTADANTALLLSDTNAGIFDQTAKNDITTYGAAAISTTQSQFGGSSMYFDGSTSYLTTSPSNAVYMLGDFTIEFWVYTTQTTRADMISPNYVYTSTGWYLITFGLTNTTSIEYYEGGTQRIIGTLNRTATWQHIALTKSGTSVRLFVNGTQTGSTYTTTQTQWGAANSGLIIGDQYSSSTYYSGYIDDLRITNGYARYTTNFTVPSSAFLNQ